MNNITSNHWDEFHLNSLNTNDGKPKIIATTLAFFFQKTRTVISSGHVLEVVLRFPRKTTERHAIYQISINVFQ